MTDRKQFEAMLEALVNDNTEKARDIFHNIVVSKSREIYEGLLSDEFDDERPEDEDTMEAADDEDDDDAFDDEDEDDDTDIGGDASDDLISDVDDSDDDDEDEFGGDEDEFGGDEEDEEGDLKDRVLDLEDALEELKSEFEELMADEKGEPEHADLFGGEEEDEFGGEEDEFGGEEDEFGGEEKGGFGASRKPKFGGGEDEFGSDKEFEQFMEYVNKVSLPKHGDNGVNTKSIVAKKNNMGGTTANIAKSFSSEKGGTKGGLLNPSPKEENFGNVNVPGANVGKTAFKKKQPGHGPERKGTGEKTVNKKSIIGSSK